MIKKYLKQGNLPLVMISVLLTVLASAPAQARIGDTRESLESRLTSSGGIIYRDDELEQSRRRGMPYTQYLEMLGSSANVRVYFKTADGRRPTTSELESNRALSGWDLHVVYVNGYSVLEMYKRSQSINEYELNQLISVQGDGSGWKKLDQEGMSVSAFGCNLGSNDGAIRAKKFGNDRILFIATEIDKKLSLQKTNDLRENAPISVEGF